MRNPCPTKGCCDTKKKLSTELNIVSPKLRGDLFGSDYLVNY
jgi:hypothetical protein